MGGRTPVPWLDVCTHADYEYLRDQFCEDVFLASTLAFSPWYPRAQANMTIILHSERSFSSIDQRRQRIHVKLPGFEPVGEVNYKDALLIDLPLTAQNPVLLGQDPAVGYNTQENPVFESPAQYDTVRAIFVIKIKVGQTFRGNVDTEIKICCVTLPTSSELDDPAYKISMEENQGPEFTQPTMVEAPILSSPYLDFGKQWKNVYVLFNPPLARQKAGVYLSLTPASDLGDGNRIILHMPKVWRESGTLVFDTAGTLDWMRFQFYAYWDNTGKTLTFFLRDGATLAANHTVTLRTGSGEFLLPSDMPSNWESLRAEVRSADNIDEIIRARSISQSGRVPPVRTITYSRLSYAAHNPGAMTDVTLTFSTNRPLFAGLDLHLRLSGFTAESLEIELAGPAAPAFDVPIVGPHAFFDLPANELVLRANSSLFSETRNATVTLRNLVLPPALYANDPSLLIWTSDPGAQHQSIDVSPIIGGGDKTFWRSQVSFSPSVPMLAANISFTIQPTIKFYQDDRILLYLYGFRYQDVSVPLLGPGAAQLGGSAYWINEDSVLVLTVAKDEVISNAEPLEFFIPLSANFRLPEKLSPNDGTIRIQGVGAVIHQEPFKKTPALGDVKHIVDSRLEFYPTSPGNPLSLSIATLVFSFVLNCDVLPNSTIFIKLGGIGRDVPQTTYESGPVELWGQNAPLFNNFGMWDASLFELRLQMVAEANIDSGFEITFYIERDQYFKLPYAMYSNDPSFTMSIPEAGIPESKFNYSTKVGEETKTFMNSVLCYGQCGGVSLPRTVVELILKFTPNVVLPEGSVIRLVLPGFTSPSKRLPLAGQERPILGQADLFGVIRFGDWDQHFYTFDLTVPPFRAISRTAVWFMRVPTTPGFMLPADELPENSRNLTIACIANQIIYAEPIKASPLVVTRSFQVSTFSYFPERALNIFKLEMELQPTVNITSDTDIVIDLLGFRNTLSKFNVHVSGRDRNRILDSMGQWNETSMMLTLKVPEEQPIAAFTTIQLQIEESQGFILPGMLKANDTRIRISSKDNIPWEPVKKSPMIGDGPFPNHLICMMQYEYGVRTAQSICDAATSCVPPLLDPCSRVELERCGCEPPPQEVLPLTVLGFQLLASDRIVFTPRDFVCGGLPPDYISAFTAPSLINVSAQQDTLEFHNISSLRAGHFRLCVVHASKTYDAGTILVRPSCRSPMVFVDGVCVEHCPSTRIPYAGNCVPDPLARDDAWQEQVMMLPVKVHGKLAESRLADAPPTDPSRQYFEYVYRYELSRLLACDPSRVKVVSLSNGSLIVSTVFTALDPTLGPSSERTPRALVSLLRALQDDASSSLYASDFFRDIDRDYRPPPVPVRTCPDVGSFSPFCPFLREKELMSEAGAAAWAITSVLGFAITVFGLCVFAWRIDHDSGKASPFEDEDVIHKIHTDPFALRPEMLVDYSTSWLEGRLAGEDWERRRLQASSLKRNQV